MASHVRLLALLIFALSPGAFADPPPACAVPVCDLDARVKEFRDSPQQRRYRWINEYTALARGSNDAALLRNLAELGKRVSSLFREIREEAWMIRASDGLAAVCLERLMTNPATPAAELIGYYRDARADATRFEVLKFWRLRVKDAATKDELVEINRFFAFAAEDSRQNARWVLEQAYGGLDSISTRLFRSFDLTLDEMKAYFKQVAGDQGRYDIVGVLSERADRERQNEALLVRLSGVLEFAVAENAGRPRWVVDRAKQALQAVNQRLLRRPGVPGEEMAGFFRGLDTDASRNDTLSYWVYRLKHVTGRDALIELAKFFHLARLDCLERRNGDWVVHTAASGENAASERIGRYFPLHEGVYEVVTHCADRPDGPPVEEPGSRACEGGYIDRLVILNSEATDGWQAALVHSGTGRFAFLFNNLAFSRGMTRFEAVTGVGGVLSRLGLDFDPRTREVRGAIRNSESERWIVVRGRQLLSTEPLYARQRARGIAEPAPIERLDGAFAGEYGGRPARLRLRVLQASGTAGAKPQVGGVLTFDALPGVVVSFHYGNYDPESGMLTLVSSDSSGNRLRLVGAVVPREDGALELEGLSLRAFTGSKADFAFHSVAGGP
jgi:hypothetical protein